MKRFLFPSLLLVALVIFCLGCRAESSDLDKANKELFYVETAIKACLADAGTTQLDLAVTAWDGSVGKVTATGADGSVHDARHQLQEGMVFRATYDVAQNGYTTDGHSVSWKGVEFDGTYPVPHWVKAP